MKIDPILSLALSMQSSKGLFALLLGSGISRPAGIPTGWDVVLDLIRRVAKAAGEDCEPDPEKWFTLKYGVAPDYSELLKELAPTPSLRQQILRSYFEPSDGEREQGLKQPTAAHRAIARLVAAGHIRVILTTNFDRLLERAVEEEGVAPAIVSSHDAVAGCLPLTHQPCTIIKLHGDYLDTRILNTPEELESYDPALEQMLDRVLDEYGLIVSGWSGEWDAALRAAMERCSTRRFAMYWASVSDPRDTAQRLVTLRGGRIIRVADADSFFSDLATKIDVLDRSAEDHPASVAVAIALVKRYAAKPEGRIQLHDLLLKEAGAVVDAADGLVEKFRGVKDQEEHLAAVQYFADTTSKLRRLLGYAAHWGGEMAVPIAAKCIERLSQDRLPPGGSGMLRPEWMRALLGGTAMFAAGVGFVTAGHFVPAARMLTLATTESHSRREGFAYFFTYHLGAVRQVLNRSREGRFVPFAELMFDRLSAELPDLAASQTAFDTSFDEWELLLGFIYADVRAGQPGAGDISWLTLGRYIYKLTHLGIRSDLYPSLHDPDNVERVRSQQPFAELLAAGFFGGKAERVLELRQALLKTAMSGRYS
jgi:hypothetical protein